jgi:amidophosphoribosyltransferase
MQILRDAGAKELHLRISAPPTTDPCYYGVDTPDKSKLIAAHKSIEEIRQYLGADSLGYLSIDGLYRAVGAVRGRFCDACFSGKYPAGVPSDFDNQMQLVQIIPPPSLN